MKKFALPLLMLSTPCLAAETTLEIKVTAYYFEHDKEVVVDIAELNAELSALGLAAIPEVVVVSDDPAAVADEISSAVEAANAALEREMHFNVHDDGYGVGYVYELPLCYRGDITGVPARLQSMIGNFLNEEQSIMAIAAGTEKVLLEDTFKSRETVKEYYGDMYEDLESEIDAWFEYKSTSTKALVMSNLGSQGDGTELYATTIKRCRN